MHKKLNMSQEADRSYHDGKLWLEGRQRSCVHSKISDRKQFFILLILLDIPLSFHNQHYLENIHTQQAVYALKVCWV